MAALVLSLCWQKRGLSNFCANCCVGQLKFYHCMRVVCSAELPQWCVTEMRSVDSIIHRLSIFHNQLGPVSLWQLIVVQCFIQNPSQEGGLAPTISRTACWTILWWNVLIDFYWLSQYCIQTITGGAITIKMTAIFEPDAFNFIFRYLNCLQSPRATGLS